MLLSVLLFYSALLTVCLVGGKVGSLEAWLLLLIKLCQNVLPNRFSRIFLLFLLVRNCCLPTQTFFRLLTLESVHDG